jgi:hypothetical protein
MASNGVWPDRDVSTASWDDRNSGVVVKNGAVAKEEEQWGCCVRKKRKRLSVTRRGKFIDFSLI